MKDFIWGVSTSAYQIEGAVAEDGRLPSIWDVRCKTQYGVGDGSNADTACDHYHRYPEDIALLQGLGLDAYRFSLAWPRIIPKGRGKINSKGLDFYDRILDRLLEAGITPWATLYHWDYPQALHDLGGWANRDSAGWFADYAVVCARHFGDRIKNWATFNEFSVFTLFGYAINWAAPGITDRNAHLQAIHHVNMAHGAGVDVLRSHVKDAHIGAIHNRQEVLPEGGREENKAAAALLDEHWNLAFPDPQILGCYPPQIAEAIDPYVKGGDVAQICRPVDWFGLNHYGPIFAKADPSGTWGFGWGDNPKDVPDYGVGWPIFPDSFRTEILRIDERYKLPIYITENGCGGSDSFNEEGKIIDTHRLNYFKVYQAAMQAAIKQGANVKGYFVWSLLDNFEWGSGYGPRFGLVHVDFETQKRTPKASYYWYKDWIRANIVTSIQNGVIVP